MSYAWVARGHKTEALCVVMVRGSAHNDGSISIEVWEDVVRAKELVLACIEYWLMED